MIRRRLRVVFAVLVFTAVGLLTVLSSISGSALRDSQEVGRASRLIALTPTPVATPGSVPGSTDGIMWMGAVVTLIILLPIVFTKITWTKS